MTICRIAVIAFGVLWALAIVVLLIGTFGWFGQEQDPLSGVFLVPLGLPWNRLADSLGLSGMISGLLSPGANLVILGVICQWLRSRSQ